MAPPIEVGTAATVVSRTAFATVLPKLAPITSLIVEEGIKGLR